MNWQNQIMPASIFDYLTFSTFSGENGNHTWEVTRQGTVLAGEVYYARQNQETFSKQRPSDGEFRPLVKHLIYQHSGVLSPGPHGRFIAFFPDATSQHEDVPRAISCALTIAEELSRLNEHRGRLDAPPLRISLGMDAGMVQLRTTTQGHKLKGAQVDTAVYLSELNKQTPFHAVFASKAVQSALHGSYDWHLEHLGLVTAGAPRTLQVYAVMRTPNLVAENDV